MKSDELAIAYRKQLLFGTDFCLDYQRWCAARVKNQILFIKIPRESAETPFASGFIENKICFNCGGGSVATGVFTYHVLWNNFNGDSNGDSKGAGLEKTNVYSFWHSRWSEKFQDTGRPPNSWQSDFFQHDVITWLELDGKVKACHLYSFYDLNQVQESEYFRYLQGDSVQNILNGFGPRTMTMEYLCASGGREEVPLTLGATMIALGSRLAFAENCGSVLGMPIDGTSVSRKVKDLGMGAICIEKGIQKYGYQLRLLATNPFVAMANEPASAKHWLNELWDQRSTSLQPPLVMTA